MDKLILIRDLIKVFLKYIIVRSLRSYFYANIGSNDYFPGGHYVYLKYRNTLRNKKGRAYHSAFTLCRLNVYLLFEPPPQRHKSDQAAAE